MKEYYRVPKPPEYMMNPGYHSTYIKDERIIRIIEEVGTFIRSTDAQRNIMCENILRILGVPEDQWNPTESH